MKLSFVRCLCRPNDGWEVFVDIDASEEGRTGGRRASNESRQRQIEMRDDGRIVRALFGKLGVHVGQRRRQWERVFDSKIPWLPGDRDIVAVDVSGRKVIVAEVEGESSGQPEQKVYRALGQIIIARGECELAGYDMRFLVVVPPRLKPFLSRAAILKEVGIGGVVIDGRGRCEYLF